MKDKSRHTPIKETLHQVLGKMKMYKIPASPNWYYEFWIGKCKLFPKGKRERKSTDETKYTIAKEIATENYMTYLSAKKNNNIKQIAKVSNMKVENSFEYVGQLFLVQKRKDDDIKVEARTNEALKKNPDWSDIEYNDYKTKLNDQKIREHKRLKDMLNDMTLDFGKKDVKEITKHDILNFVYSLKTKDNRPYTDSSKNKYRTLAKQILNYAYDNTNDKGDRFLDQQIVIPTTSNTSQNFNPPFTTENFDKISLELKRRMYDVSNKDLLKIIKSPTEFKKLKDDFRDKFLNHTLTHTQELWSEIHDCVMFIYGSFLRAGSEFTEMRFKDISIEDVIIDGKRIKTLQLRPIASKVKTYDYDTYSMPFCVSLFKDAMIRRENYKPNDFVFFHSSYPTYKRRNTFGKWLSDKFREVLEFTNTRHDPKTGQTMSLRCLRNTALTRRRESSNSNPFDIASNARTSTDMLNKFYNRQVDRKKIASKVLSFK